MISRIYIENDIASHPRVQDICNRFPGTDIIPCNRYSEIFNRKSQSFRLQKLGPGLILAKKRHNHVLTAPGDYGIGGDYNFYFSHMMNCLYDCRYCFLQGMYQSANYVLFVNYEDFAEQLINTANKFPGKQVHFFSGYDCDSMAMEPVTGFADYIFSVIGRLDNSLLELRTKSTQIRSLLTMPAIDNCVVAYSLNPQSIARALEHKAPDINSRLYALQKLQKHGWKIGLRFDPLIYDVDYRLLYSELFQQVFTLLDAGYIHSASLGTFRLPKGYYKKIYTSYPEEKLFASPLYDNGGTVQYKSRIRHELISHCYSELRRYLPESQIFTCEPLATGKTGH